MSPWAGMRAVIWLLRHGDAEDGSPDEERPLTAKGERQARAAGAALAALGVELDGCLASPKVRAAETARLACEALAGAADAAAVPQVELEEALRGGRFDARDLAAGRGEVLLVGHDPDFSDAVTELTGARVSMKKGGLAAIDDSELATLLRPDALAATAG